MRTFYLHAGMHKTASTSCQKLFEQKRDELEQTELRYFEAPDLNHSFFILAFFEINKPYLENLQNSGYLSSEYSDRNALVERFENFLANTPRDALLSAELAGSMKAEQIGALRDDYLQGFDLKMLALVRPPLSFARSAAQQGIKGGRTFADMLPKPPVPKYRGRFAQYVKVLGRDKVLLEVFHPSRLKDRDPAQTLLAMMGREKLDGLRAPRLNISMSATAAKLILILNAGLADPAELDRLPAAIRRALQAISDEYEYAELEKGAMTGGLLRRRLMRLAERTPGAPFKLPVEIRDAVAEASREDADWMSELLSADICGFDSAPDEGASRLGEAETFSDDEVRTVVGHLEAAPR